MGTLRVVHDWNHRNRGVKNGDISDEQTSDLNIHVRSDFALKSLGRNGEGGYHV